MTTYQRNNDVNIQVHLMAQELKVQTNTSLSDANPSQGGKSRTSLKAMIFPRSSIIQLELSFDPRLRPFFIFLNFFDFLYWLKSSIPCRINHSTNFMSLERSFSFPNTFLVMHPILLCYNRNSFKLLKFCQETKHGLASNVEGSIEHGFHWDIIANNGQALVWLQWREKTT